MSAQDDWKREYRHFKDEMETGWAGTAFEIIDNARSYVRQAALERRIERMDREIRALIRENKDLEDRLVEANKQAWHDRM